MKGHSVCCTSTNSSVCHLLAQNPLVGMYARNIPKHDRNMRKNYNLVHKSKDMKTN